MVTLTTKQRVLNTKLLPYLMTGYYYHRTNSGALSLSLSLPPRLSTS
jgi:hypothetical protein